MVSLGVLARKIFGSSNDRRIKSTRPRVEAINAIAGERCSPHPHNFTDRLIRPGDQAYFDLIQSYMGYKTCYYRTFTVGSATAAQHDALRALGCDEYQGFHASPALPPAEFASRFAP